MSVLGQNAQPTCKEPPAFEDTEHFRKVLSVVGRTGCALALRMIREESSEEMCAVLQSVFTQKQLDLVRYVGVDNPSGKLYHDLKKYFRT